MSLLERFRAWRKRRYWQRQQMDHLRSLILSDWRWLAHDPIANALTTRYKNALSESWYSLEHEPSETLRSRLGLDPHQKHIAAAQVAAPDSPSNEEKP